MHAFVEKYVFIFTKGFTQQLPHQRPLSLLRLHMFNILCCLLSRSPFGPTFPIIPLRYQFVINNQFGSNSSRTFFASTSIHTRLPSARGDADKILGRKQFSFRTMQTLRDDSFSGNGQRACMCVHRLETTEIQRYFRSVRFYKATDRKPGPQDCYLSPLLSDNQNCPRREKRWRL